MLPRLLAVPAAVLISLAATEAHAKRGDPPPNFGDHFTPMGAVIELMPGVSMCMPTAAAACKTREGSTGPMAGGQFSIGYRAHRNIAIGAAYVGSAVTLDWKVRMSDSLPNDRDFEGFGQIHAGYAWARPMVGYRRWDFGFEVGAGFSWMRFPMSAPPEFESMYSRGFSLLLAPTIDVFLTRHFYLGLRTNFIMNVQTKVCQETTMGKDCRDRNKGDDQLPIHQVIPGIHLGFVI